MPRIEDQHFTVIAATMPGDLPQLPHTFTTSSTSPFTTTLSGDRRRSSTE